MSNPVILWLAGLLGWDPGFVIVLITVLCIFLLFWLVKLLVIDLPYWLADKKNRASGGTRLVLGLLLIVAVLVSIFINFIVTILAVLAVVSLAGQARDWWHKGIK